MHGFAGDEDYGESEPGRLEFLLGGGAVVPGVDYEGEWLRARAVAQGLNRAFAAMGLKRGETLFAQAGFADDGSGVVFMTGTLAGAGLLRALLEERLAAECEGGPVAGGEYPESGESRHAAGRSG